MMVMKGIDFVNRVPKFFRKDAETFRLSDETDKIIEVNIPPQKSRYGLQRHGIDKNELQPFKLRFVKVTLDTGETEILATTLLDKEKYPIEIFKDLYFKRWGIETNYDHLKSNIHIEEFTGLSEIAIRQDFYASSFINNLQSIIALDSLNEMDNEEKDRKYEYKINRNLSLGFMKDRIIEILTSNNPKYYDELKELFKMNPNPIRKSRNNPRKHQDKNRRKYFMNRKRAV